MKNVYVTYMSFKLRNEWIYYLLNFVDYFLFLLLGLLIFEGWNTEGLLAILITALAGSSSHTIIMSYQDRKKHFAKKYRVQPGHDQ